MKANPFMQDAIRLLMQQRETDGPVVKQLKWDYWTLRRIRHDYAVECETNQIDFEPLLNSLVELVGYASGT